MEEMIKLLRSDPEAAIANLTADSKDEMAIKNLREEFLKTERSFRPTQIGMVQKDKLVGKGEKARLVQGVRVPVPFPNKIVATATAFEVGEPSTLLPSEENTLSKEVLSLWKYNRIDSVLIKLKMLQKSELQSALLFYIDNLKNKGKGKRKIKVNVLENKKGKMTPYFDAFGDMVFFTWEFLDKDEDGKEQRNVWIYDENKTYKCRAVDGRMQVEDEAVHGFSKIPVVYLSQEDPDWFLVQSMIDRFEVALSKLGASNDYSGHPILMIYGEVVGAPEKDEDGKAMRFNMVEDDATGKISHGDAKFLTREGSAESVEMELDKLEKFIYSMTSTPDISFDNIKGLGNVSGVAIRLMFLDAIIKAKMNEGENRTIMERILNIFISGTITTTMTGTRSAAESLFFDIQFNSILPDDLSDSVTTLVNAVQGKIMSQKTAIESLDMAEDAEEEMELISAQESGDKKPANL